VAAELGSRRILLEETMSHCVSGHPEEAHLFGVDAESPRARVIDSGRSWRSRADENSAASARKGGANHKRISVPGASTFSQQRTTSFDHYESAWRTSNTGSNPVGRKEMTGEFLSRPSRRPLPVHGRAPAGRPRLRRELSGEVFRRGGSRSMGR